MTRGLPADPAHFSARPWPAFGVGSRWSPLLVHTFIISLPLLLAIDDAAPALILGVGGVCVMVGYALLAVMEGRRAHLVVSPLSFYFAWCTVGLGLAPLWHSLAILDGATEFDLAGARVSISDVASGYVLMLVGSWFLHAGMTFTRPAERAPASDVDRPFPVGAFIALWVAGVALTLGRDAVASAGNLATFFQSGARVALIAFALEATRRRVYRPRFVILFLLALLLELVIGFGSGSKTRAMTAIEFTAWVVLVRKQFRWTAAPLFAAVAVLYLGFVAPVINEARVLPTRPGESFYSRIERVVRYGETASSQASRSAFDQFMVRQFEAVAVGFIVDDVRRTGLRSGATMGYLLYAWIPRIIWPDKPAVTQGGAFDQYARQGAAESALGQTPEGELYWNFGFVGVALGMLAIGALGGAIWRLAGAEPEGRPLHLLLYYYVTMTIVGMAEAGTPIIAHVTRLIFFSVLFWVISLSTDPSRSHR